MRIGHLLSVARIVDIEDVARTGLSYQRIERREDIALRGALIDQRYNLVVSALAQHLPHTGHILVAVDFRPGTVLLLSQSDDQGILGLGKDRQSKQGLTDE